MPVPHRTALSILRRLANGDDPEIAARVLDPRLPGDDPLPPRLPAGNEHNLEAVHKRLDILKTQGIELPQVSNPATLIDPASLESNIENLVGCARIPIGVIGPLRINGFHAHGDFYVPLATSEGALVASYNRGAYLIGQAGGAAVAALTESVSRAPAFVFRGLSETLRFLAWALDSLPHRRQASTFAISLHHHHPLRLAIRPRLQAVEVDTSWYHPALQITTTPNDIIATLGNHLVV